MRSTWLKAGAGVLLAALALVAGGRYLIPLTALPGSMKFMLATTHDILAQTEQMQGEVGRVQANLAKLQQQEALLDEQSKLMGGLLNQLAAQEQSAGQARELLVAILQTEQTTAALTAEANRKGAATRQTVAADKVQLDRLAASAAAIQKGSNTVNSQMDSLLASMSETRAEFAPVGRLKRAAAGVLERWGNWLQSLVRYFYG
jgi:chromosome segregation ATPase